MRRRLTHRVISLRRGIWSLSEHSGLRQPVHPANLRIHGLVESGRLRHRFQRLGLAGPYVERIGTAILPGAVALADAGGRPDQRLHVDPFIGHGGDGLVLAARQVEFLDAAVLRRRNRDAP